MPKKKTIEELDAKKAEWEEKLKQLAHREARINNRIRHLHEADRKKRTHHLCTRMGYIEHCVPELKELTESYISNNLYLMYDHQCEPPADFLEECRLYWENIKRIRTEKETPIYYVIEPDGTTYFYHGSTKIKVIEHFNGNGKPITTLVEDVIQYAAAN